MCHPCAIMWEADMPPAVGRIAAPRAWPLLIKVYWAIRIWYEVCVCLGLSEFSFSYRNIVGTGGFSGRAIMRPRMLFYWICPLVTPLPVGTGDFLEGHHAASGCCSIAMPSSHSHSHITLAWFASSLSTAIHLPIPNHQVWQCFAHIKHLSIKHITSGLVRFFPSPLPLVHSLTLPQQVSSAIHGLLVVCMVIWGSI